MLTIDKIKAITEMIKSMSYDFNGLEISQNKVDLFFGIGLISYKYGLSKGLPLDIVYLLLFAKLTQVKIKEQSPGTDPKLTIILDDAIALQMAPLCKKTASPQAINDLILIYLEQLNFLIKLLNMQDHTEILVTSTFIEKECYQAIKKELEIFFSQTQDTNLITIKNDHDHFPYYLSQSAIMKYLYEMGFGIKISWVKQESLKKLKKGQLMDFARDELFFDELYKKIYSEDTLQFVQIKAGLEQAPGGKEIAEVAPYIAYNMTCSRYIIGEKTSKLEINKQPARIKKRLNSMGLIIRKLADLGEIALPSSLLDTNNFLSYCLNQPLNEFALNAVRCGFFKIDQQLDDKALDDQIISRIKNYLTT